MNERIRQLAEQARAEVRAEWDKGNKIPYPEAHLAFQRDNDQKFAELIVRECAGLFPNVYVEIENEYGHTPVVAADYIKKHFGVEE